MKRFDITLKDVISGLERAFCKSFLNMDIIEAKPLDSDLQKIEEKQADYIARIKDKDRREYILHIEFQSTNHKSMHIRMLRYLTELYNRYNLPVIQTVVYLGKEKLRMRDRISFEAYRTKIDYRYELIDTRSLDCELFLNSNESDFIILSILCDLEKRDKSKFIRKVLRRLYELNRDDENSLKNYLLKLETVAELREELKPIIKEEESMIDFKVKVEDLPSYEIGFERGIQKGVERGIERGKEEERIALVKSLLKLGVDIKIIKEATGFSKDEIEKIKESFIAKGKEKED